MYASATIHYCKRLRVEERVVPELKGNTILALYVDTDGVLDRQKGSFELTLFGLPQAVIDRLVAALKEAPVEAVPPPNNDDEVVA